MNRRDFVVNGLLVVGAFSLCPSGSIAMADHVYKLAPLSMLPEGLRNAPPEIRNAYRFAVLNRESEENDGRAQAGEQSHQMMQGMTE
jgi:hypothetical protein